MVKVTEVSIEEYAGRQDPENANLGTLDGQAIIEGSIKNHGVGRSIVIGADDGTIGGNKTHLAAQKVGIKKVVIVETAGDALIVHKRTDITLDSPEGRLLALEDNRSQEKNLNWDPAVVASYGVDISHLWEPGEIPTFTPPPPGEMPFDEAPPQTTGDTPDEEPPLTKDSVPDALFPTDNEWGIPVLSKLWQADAVDLPVNAWGSVGRKSKMNGTYHFYTDDYRFNNIWTDPTAIVNAGCVNVVEPNFSTNIQMPRAVVLWHVYRKRWLARYWQSQGIRVFVDLDVNEAFDELNLLGVPAGWRAYACFMYPYNHDPKELDAFLKVARGRAETDDIIMLVVGGGEDVQEMCKKDESCTWIPAFYQSFYKNVNQQTLGS